ncbi:MULTISPECIES: hypothetical protein [Pseudoalteromonas]|uniref:Uncharacterized protein n=1 Tax=Pseudoalteromonas obscura TaxID=3048491 RepID=A0ABT7EIE4_9GAMM|nr:MULTISPECIES: hypothetical protein [Pseudoalteromonas]MBQ4836469.1 hypothetical protein [Pseudoalteromonas luteoviolacea]MDK2594823.1 hypothetical protein [Pseudoalteromonas sp. P94(2023)]
MRRKSKSDYEGSYATSDNSNEFDPMRDGAPKVALWKTWGLRIIFAAMVIVLGSKQLNYLLEGASQWSNWRGLGHSMLFTLAILAIGGVFRPLAFLPVMIYEMAWKIVWLAVVALPPFLAGQEIPGIVNVKASIIGICVLIILVPWKYVWWRYFTQPIEPWRQKKSINNNK